jgi:hypothetical protein
MGTLRPDLQGLPLTRGELKYLTGTPVGKLLKPPIFVSFLSELFQSFLIAILIIIAAFFLYYIFPDHKLLLIGLSFLCSAGLFLDDVRKLMFSWQNKTLIHLFEDVERYNDVIQAIDINDQIEAAGNLDVSLQDREKVIAALELTRADLVRALRTEQILRKNKQFIAKNPELFANNLTALAALQIHDQASEQGRLLNEALQIALNAQAEMRHLQDQRLN